MLSRFTYHKGKNKHVNLRAKLHNWIRVTFCLIGMNAVVLAEEIKTYEFNIPSQPLVQSLNALSNQTETLVLFPYELVEGRTGHPVVGSYSVKEALDVLLQGTGLVGGFSRKGVLTVFEKQPVANDNQGESMMKRKSLLTAIAGVLFGAGASHELLAQDSSRGEPVAKPRVLEEIVVTARKREESLQEVPVSINVVSTDLIESLRIEGIESLASQVPGMVAGQGNSASGGSIALRGISSADSNSLTEQAVSIHIDGVPVNDARMLQARMFDLQQIEVMRGPQALFFGKNSPAGVVALHTKDPGDEFELMLTGAYETEAEAKVSRFVISGPLTESLKGRLAGSYSDQDGKFDVESVNQVTSVGGFPMGFPLQSGSFQNREDSFVLGTLLYEPNEHFTARFKVSYAESEYAGPQFFNGQRIFCPTGSPVALIPGGDCKENGKIVASGLNPQGLAGIAQLRGLATSDTRDGDIDTEFWVNSLELNYAIPNSDLNLTSVTGYYNAKQMGLGDATFSLASQLLSQGLPEAEKITQEIRLASDWDSAFNFTTGFFYEDSENTNDQTTVIIFPGLVIPLGNDTYKQEGQTWSVFFEGSWNITDKLNLSGGARYTEDEKELERSFNHVPVLQAKDSETWENLSPEVTLSYRPLSNVMLFVGYREGFKSGGFDGAFKPSLAAGGIHDFLFDEETVDGFEGGIKSTWFDDSLQLNVTAFSYDYEELQVGVNNPQTTTLAVVNAASSTTEGVEVESNWATPIEGLTLRGSLNYLDATYEDFLADCYTGQTPAEGCNQLLVGGVFRKQDLSGHELQFAPNWSGTVGFEYETPLTAGWNLGITGYASYHGSYEAAVDNLPNSAQDSYWLTNASLRLFSTDETWEIFAKGANLGNEYWHTSGLTTPLTGGGTGTPNGVRGDVLGFVAGGRELTIGVTFRY